MSPPVVLKDWWPPFWNAVQQSPFVEPVPIVGPAPSDPPLVCVQFNQQWLPYVVGALMALNQPTTWDTHDQVELGIQLQNVTELLAEVGTAGLCMCPMIRLNNCELQISCDGGVTWTTASGWDQNIHGCVLGWLPPPVPPNPQNVVVEQNACNMAGWMASQFIKVSLQQAIDTVNDSNRLAQLFQLLTGLFTPFAIYANAAIAGTNALINGVTNANVNDFITATGDANLWSAATCAIFEAIRSVGYIDASNFATVVSNLRAINYVPNDVPTMLGDYVDNIGLQLSQQLQPVGALGVVDCSGCGTWCYEWDFRQGLEHWQFESGSCGGQLCGFGLCGCEDNPGTPNQFVGVNIFRDFSPPVTISAVCMWARDNANANGAARKFIGSLAGNVVFNLDLSPSFDNYPQGAEICAPGLAVTIDRLFVAWRTAGSPPSTADIQSVKLEGPGVNPFGLNNCTY